MNNILTLSGWGQSPNAVSYALPSIPNISIHSFDYSQHTTIDTVFEQLSFHPCDTIIGWSLGGQIALRALAKKIIAPQTLVLLAPPFQFLQSPELPDGTPQAIIDQVIDDYTTNPQKMLLDFASLICLDDNQSKRLLPFLQQHIHPACPNWLYWLQELAHFSCCKLTFSSLPDLHIIHGINDRVIPFSHTNYFSDLLPTAKIHFIKACGHAPHLHQPQLLYDIITHAQSS